MDVQCLLEKVVVTDDKLDKEKVNLIINFFTESVLNENILTQIHHKKDLLTCPKCKELYYEPITFCCGHTFCKCCIKDGMKCETCLVSVSVNKSKPNIVLSTACQKWFPVHYDGRALMIEANTLSRNKKYHEALEKYSNAIQKVPQSHVAYLGRAAVYDNLGLYEESVKDIEIAVSYHGNLPEAFFIKGSVEMKLGKAYDAIVSFFTCIALGHSQLNETTNFLKKAFIQIFKLEIGAPTSSVTKNIEPTPLSGLKRKLTDTLSDVISTKISKPNPTDNIPTQQTELLEDTVKSTKIEMPSAEATISNENPSWTVFDQDIFPSADVVRDFNVTESDVYESSDDMMPEIEPIREDIDAKSVGVYKEISKAITHKIITGFQHHSQKKPRYDAENIPSMAIAVSDFECSLCMRLFYRPICTICGHSFCMECLKRSLDHKTNCPLCKQYIFQNSGEVNKSLCVEEITAKLIKVLLPTECKERIRLEEEEIKIYKSSFPVFVCTAAFPSIACPLHIFEPKYRLMLRRAVLYHDKEFGMCLPSDNKPFLETGTMLHIKDVKFFPDGRSIVSGIGTKRFRASTCSKLDGYNICKYTIIKDRPLVEAKEIETVQRLFDVVYNRAHEWYEGLTVVIQQQIIHHYGQFPEKTGTVHGENGPDWHWWVLAVLPVENKVKMTIVGKGSLKERLLIIHRVLTCLKKRNLQQTSQS